MNVKPRIRVAMALRYIQSQSLDLISKLEALPDAENTVWMLQEIHKEALAALDAISDEKAAELKKIVTRTYITIGISAVLIFISFMRLFR